MIAGVKRLIFLTVCLFFVSPGVRGWEPGSLEIFAPRSGGEYDGSLTVAMRFRNLDSGRLLVRLRLGDMVHYHIVGSDLSREVNASHPYLGVSDYWFYYQPGRQELEIVVSSLEEPDTELFRQVVPFTIKAARLDLPERMKFFASSTSLRILERQFQFLQAAAARDASAETEYNNLGDRLYRAKAYNLRRPYNMFLVLSEEYQRALQYDRALGALNRAERLLPKVIEEMSSHPVKGKVDWRLHWSESWTLPPHNRPFSLMEYMTDMYVRLGWLDEALAASRREIATAREIHEARIAEGLSSDWGERLARSLERKGFFLMLLTGDYEAFDQWREKARQAGN